MSRNNKLSRIRRGHSPRVLDLFAGCGGLSLGFEAVGFKIAAALELDPIAAETHGRNFFKRGGAASPHYAPHDITKVEPNELSDEFEFGPVLDAVDVIVGGPPCQAYARVGRAKLREVAEHPRAFLKDPRRNLYLRFLEYVEAFDPLAIVMENVPDALNHGGHNVAEETAEVLESLGYSVSYTLLNSANYGVPQMRERMFLLAYARELSAECAFPAPTNWVDFPRGYDGTRRVALKHVSPTLFTEEGHYVAPPVAERHLPPAVTACEALSDLPPITRHLRGEMKRGTRRFVEFVSYRSDVPVSDFASSMRNWPAFESKEGVLDHVIRSLPRDYQIFREMRAGDQYPEAYAVALRLFEHRLGHLERLGQPIAKGSAAYRRLRDSIVPPYDPSKFPNKWRKMEPDRPARTLMAHLGKDSYSHIHYDSKQARTISVREAARLQSFPDGFRFSGTMNPAFRQIGNAVPPLLAKAIGSSVIDALRGLVTHEQTGAQAIDGLGPHAVRMALP